MDTDGHGYVDATQVAHLKLLKPAKSLAGGRARGKAEMRKQKAET